ncbi:siroheme decarboxylase subunit beta [Prosthecodimorpha staleyi]|uniref:siroheme decarboxylase n=1 Tax=Prosthecodimorpha staleyi TaxID=2840188 RepID=A0A947D984_9HYPH|nr:AsnC family transcriptional regulator [Prosthecodimorpha staleyi]MBT9293065.1 AsnC family transcriptional regulator [Prosthecodimorpha staleyi]
MHAPLLTPLESRLLDAWQRDFPLFPEPWPEVAAAAGTSPAAALAAVANLIETGLASRLGAVVRPNTAGASTLAALVCRPTEVSELGPVVSAEAGVNHNYEREHARLPLWFVVTEADEPAVAATLNRIGTATGRPVLALPLEREYRIDLGFALGGACLGTAGPHRAGSRMAALPAAIGKVSAADRVLLAAIEDGLPLVERPYRAVAERLGLSETAVLARLAAMVAGGAIKRFGIIVRHRPLGWRANAMVVFDAPADAVDDLADLFLDEPAVTLLYRRRPAPPLWPYRLYAMIHGRDRGEVGRVIERLVARAGCPLGHEILFSSRCFKQTGARFSRVLEPVS